MLLHIVLTKKTLSGLLNKASIAKKMSFISNFLGSLVIIATWVPKEITIWHVFQKVTKIVIKM